jgi:hypothetical protein
VKKSEEDMIADKNMFQIRSYVKKTKEDIVF